ncbi:MAG: hypothetical protein AAFR61_28625 [Bacteroidota bacterium]
MLATMITKPLQTRLGWMSLLCLLLFFSSCRLWDGLSSPSRSAKNVLCKNLELTASYKDQYSMEGIPPFNGIEHWLDRDTLVNILMIPGMRHKEWHNYNTLIISMVDSINQGRASKMNPISFSIDTVRTRLAAGQPPLARKMIGHGQIITFHFASEAIPSKNIPRQDLCFFIANWTPITSPAKASLIRLDQQLNHPEAGHAKHQKGEQEVERTHLSDIIKNQYFIDILGDLALYRQNNYRQAIHGLVEEVFRRIDKNGHTEQPLICITGSMGSEIAMNVFLDRMSLLDRKIASLEAGRQELGQNLSRIEAGQPREANQLIDEYIQSLSLESKKILQQQQHLQVSQQAVANKYVVETLEKFKQRASSQKENTLIKKEIDDFIKEEEERASHEVDFLTNQIRSLKSIFMLNNQLIFTGILDYNVDSLNLVTVEKMIESKLRRIINLQKKYGEIQMLKNRSFSEEDELQIVSFYDVNDVLGFRLPQNNLMLDIPISHSIKWTMNAQRLKDNFLYRYPLKGLRYSMASNIRDKRQINAMTNLEQPSEGAKNNPFVGSYMVKGWAGPGSKTSLKPPGPSDHEPNKQETNRNTSSELLRLARAAHKITKHVRPKELPHAFAPDTTVLGLEATFDQHDTIHVLTVHGMGSKEVDHFDQMAHLMAEQMGFVNIPALESVSYLPLGRFRYMRGSANEREGTPPSSETIYASIRELWFENSANKKLHFSIVHWSPIAIEVKRELAKLNREAARDSRIPYKDKSLIHKQLKNLIVIDGLVDVNLAFGQGNFLGRMSEAVEAGVKKIIHHNPGTGKNIYLITGSLGSRILFEHLAQTLNKVPDRPRDPHETSDSVLDSRARLTQVLLRKTEKWYMLNNQLSLISLKDSIAKGQTELKAHLWQKMNSARQQKMLEGISFDLIAFHDPNDILTFQIPQPDSALGKHIRLTNVVMRTAEGFEVDMRKMYKFLKRVDKKVYRSIKIDLHKDQNNWDNTPWHNFWAWVAVVPFNAQRKAIVPERVSNKAVNKERKLLKKMIDVLEKQLADPLDTAEIAAIHQAVRSLSIRKAELDKERKKNRSFHKYPIFTPAFISVDQDFPKRKKKKPKRKMTQKFVLRLDLAHDAVKYNPRILDMICLGTPLYQEKGEVTTLPASNR